MKPVELLIRHMHRFVRVQGAHTYICSVCVCTFAYDLQISCCFLFGLDVQSKPCRTESNSTAPFSLADAYSSIAVCGFTTACLIKVHALAAIDHRSKLCLFILALGGAIDVRCPVVVSCMTPLLRLHISSSSWALCTCDQLDSVAVPRTLFSSSSVGLLRNWCLWCEEQRAAFPLL